METLPTAPEAIAAGHRERRNDGNVRPGGQWPRARLLASLSQRASLGGRTDAGQAPDLSRPRWAPWVLLCSVGTLGEGV